MNRKFVVRTGFLSPCSSLWEYYGRRVNPILFTYPSAIARAFVELLASGELWSYMQQSLLVLTYASTLRCGGWRRARRRHGALHDP